MLHGYTVSFANWAIVHPHLHRQLRPQALEDVQAHCNLLYELLHCTFCSGEVFSSTSCCFPGSYAYQDTSTNPASICLGTPAACAIAHSENSSQASQGLEARPIISFFHTWAAPFQFSVPLSLSLPRSPFHTFQVNFRYRNADPEEYVQLVSQDLSGFFTSIPVERFHQALQVLLHQYDLKVGLQNVSHWSVSEIKSDYRRRLFKGKCRISAGP